MSLLLLQVLTPLELSRQANMAANRAFLAALPVRTPAPVRCLKNNSGIHSHRVSHGINFEYEIVTSEDIHTNKLRRVERCVYAVEILDSLDHSDFMLEYCHAANSRRRATRFPCLQGGSTAGGTDAGQAAAAVLSPGDPKVAAAARQLAEDAALAQRQVPFLQLHLTYAHAFQRP